MERENKIFFFFFWIEDRDFRVLRITEEWEKKNAEALIGEGREKQITNFCHLYISTYRPTW